ncbi:MAG TPA: hypothetical protein PLH70_06700 [Bacteroidales bacterium]|nr:hypothetical protein [Bacteroidales bacterium]HOH22597.1 hypothetical protein [Bacteroidales bacterium]HPZ03919.1 hypothetical protein [Bacteroidales bacterium]HQB75469.1 hypothetical protein [Bacteroidales bacterium]HQQ20693.1 hypothetical protein [Bacteroidales bacterium]
MKLRFFYFLLLIVMLGSCNSNKESSTLGTKGKEQTEILQALQVVDSLYQNKVIDIPQMSHFVTTAKQFAENYPEDKMAPHYLFKAGVLSMEMAGIANNKTETVRFAQDAINIFNDIQKVYPDFEDIRLCIYNRGVVYDNILHDYRSAEIEFRDYIHKYPQDANTEWLIEYVDKYLGKTTDELASEIIVDSKKN